MNRDSVITPVITYKAFNDCLHQPFTDGDKAIGDEKEHQGKDEIAKIALYFLR